jgi:GxxExxY protein
MLLADERLTYLVIGCFRHVYNRLCYGLLESAYVGALVHVCTSRGLLVERELHVPFYFDGVVVANYRLDIVIERRLIVEIKACKALRPEHIKQVQHYLLTTDFELGLLFNFGPQPETRRFTYRNSLKNRS